MSKVQLYLNYSPSSAVLVGPFKDEFKNFREKYLTPDPKMRYHPKLTVGKGWLIPWDCLDEMMTALEKDSIEYQITDTPKEKRAARPSYKKMWALFQLKSKDKSIESFESFIMESYADKSKIPPTSMQKAMGLLKEDKKENKGKSDKKNNKGKGKGIKEKEIKEKEIKGKGIKEKDIKEKEIKGKGKGEKKGKRRPKNPTYLRKIGYAILDIGKEFLSNYMIRKYILANYKVSETLIKYHMKKNLQKGVDKGYLIQNKQSFQLTDAGKKNLCKI